MCLLGWWSRSPRRRLILSSLTVESDRSSLTWQLLKYISHQVGKLLNFLLTLFTAKAGTCARDRRAPQQLALNVHVKHSDLTWPDLTCCSPLPDMMRALLRPKMAFHVSLLAWACNRSSFMFVRQGWDRHHLYGHGFHLAISFTEWREGGKQEVASP